MNVICILNANKICLHLPTIQLLLPTYLTVYMTNDHNNNIELF